MGIDDSTLFPSVLPLLIPPPFSSQMESVRRVLPMLFSADGIQLLQGANIDLSQFQEEFQLQEMQNEEYQVDLHVDGEKMFLFQTANSDAIPVLSRTGAPGRQHGAGGGAAQPAAHGHRVPRHALPELVSLSSSSSFHRQQAY